ncbi:cobalamin-binding protein [Oceaniserpentilla sp. 4NH20-0058]|uniref:cobalamin-binding protein n=1 Tax=Oceaniserpentilla sp. 4NH20-0058 TaxID=3127660 RepID=UPI00310482B7
MQFKKMALVITIIWLMLNSVKSVAQEENSIQRIIALAPHAVELVFMLGAGDRIVATTEYADYPEAAKNIPRIGGYSGIQIERVLELKPDLIIAWQGGNKAQDIKKMQDLGLPVYLSITKKLDDIPKEMLSLGEKLGLKKIAQVNASEFNQRLAKIRLNNAKKSKVSVFYQLWSEPLRAMAAGSWINEMVEGCAGVNIFNDNALDYPQVSIENVLLAKPDVIVIPSQHGSKIEAGDKWASWPEIPAVKNKQIYFINGDLLHRFSGRILQGMQNLCDKFDIARTYQL